jgi:hypothetical protein
MRGLTPDAAGRRLACIVRPQIMIASVDSHGRTEQRMHSDLLLESARDLIFVFNIRQYADWFNCDAAEIPDFMERAIRFLLEHDVKVGIGDPDSPSWRPSTEFAGDAAKAAKRIVDAWSLNPDEMGFLVFASRAKQNAA